MKMTDYREILRLRSLGLNRTQIADSLGASRTTVISALQRAAAQGLDWQTAESLSDRELAARLYPQGYGTDYKIPDYEYIHRELAKAGVTQQLLWFEYCDQCRATGEVPYQLTQFKSHYREYVIKTKGLRQWAAFGGMSLSLVFSKESDVPYVSGKRKERRRRHHSPCKTSHGARVGLHRCPVFRVSKSSLSVPEPFYHVNVQLAVANVQFCRRRCSTPPPRGVQPRRRIHGDIN
jgi:IS30 family transposase